MKNSTYTSSGKILITAAGGKVGRHVVRQLAERKVSSRAAFHSQSKASEVREAGIEAAVLEFESPESIAAAFRDIELRNRHLRSQTTIDFQRETIVGKSNRSPKSDGTLILTQHVHGDPLILRPDLRKQDLHAFSANAAATFVTCDEELARINMVLSLLDIKRKRLRRNYLQRWRPGIQS